jgi:hypothetical protein
MGMKRILSGSMALLIAPMLSSCQPPTYTVFVSAVPGGIELNGRDDGSGPFSWGMDGIYADEISISDGTELIGKLTRQPGGGPECRTKEEHDPFPLTIAAAGVLPPPCWQRDRPVFALRAGVLYTIETNGSPRWGHGRFRIIGARVENTDYQGQPIQP